MTTPGSADDSDWEGAVLAGLGDVIPGVPGRAAGTMPFGRYAGQPASVVLADEGYCRWLLRRERRPWLGERHPEVLDWLLAHFPDPPPYVPRPPEPPEETARYAYRGADGALLYTVVRWLPKGFTVEAPDGAELTVAEAAPAGVLYRLPELAALPPGSTVHVCEGEADADAVAGLGLAATTAPFGTRPKGAGWQPRYTPWLAGRHVVILPDADGPGRRHAQDFAEQAGGTALSAVVCDLHEGRHGPWDVSDWLARRGRGRAELEAAVARARFAAAGREWRKGGPNRAEREDLVWSSRLPSTSKLVLLAACYLATWRDGEAWPSAGEIGGAAGLHRVTAQNTVTGLRRAGVVAGDGIAWDVLAVS